MISQTILQTLVRLAGPYSNLYEKNSFFAEIVVKSLGGLFQMEKLEKAIFAGGCFWCLEPSFETLSSILC